MRVVYSDVHLRHDITHETILGEEIPAYEVAERAERIREALDADGGFERVAPDGARPWPRSWRSMTKGLSGSSSRPGAMSAARGSNARR